MEVSQKSLKKNLFYSYIQKFVSLIMPVITFPYASRILLPDGIGKVNFSQSIVYYFVIIAGLGIGTYAIREGAKLRDNDDKFSKFSKEIISINLTSTLISYVLLFFTLVFVKQLHPYVILIVISSSTMILTVFGVDWLYSAKEEFKYISIRSIIFQLVSLVYLFAFVKTANDIVHYVIYGVLSGAGSNLINIIYSRHFIKWRTHYKLEIKQHLKPIFILFGISLAQTIYLVLDVSILGFISGDQAVGFYTAASKINKMVLSLLMVQNSIFLPRLSYYAEHDLIEYKALLVRSFELYTMFLIPSFIGFCILSKDILIIFCGSNYLPAINTMYILNGIIVIISLSVFFGSSVFTSFRKDKYSLYICIIGAISNLILNFILIPKYSHVGAAIATIIAESLVTISCIFLTIKTIGFIKEFFTHFYQFLIAGFLMGAGVFFVHYYLHDKLLYIILEIFIGFIVYTTVLYFFRNILLLDLFRFINNKVKSIFKKSK